ncbi:nuclear basket protein megator isoform X2 [Leptinotarsa decemlineata]|uniref:nuclear basket protein megator isoform X2 n=1 Tax=Leptinotarsa decemlineata TaxID=7539 RepID=UPI003D305004
MEGSFIFASVVSEGEWQSVPTEIGVKISKFVSEKFDEFITSKALLETKCFNLEQTHGENQTCSEKLELEAEILKTKLEVAAKTIEEQELQLATLSSEVSKLHTQCNVLEAETAEYRHQRNLALDERDEHLKMIQRRNSEVERLQSDINSLTKQLETAVNAKCEALAQADEVASMKITLEYREKRMEQERSLLNSQVQSLTDELNQRTEELLNMRRDNTSRCIQLETKLTEKTQELSVALEQIKSLTDINNNMVARNEELSQKMMDQREVDAKMNESYAFEIEAKTKMANAYQSMYEESQQHANELKEALSELQELLRSATEQYGQLETKHKESELAHEEILLRKNECIDLLKKELETANEIIDATKTDQLQKDIEGLSPNVSSASKLIKSGMSYSEVYSRYVSVTEQFTNKEEECARLNNYITCIVREIEEKGPLIKKLRQDYSNTLDANDALKDANETLLREIQELRESNAECKRLEGVTARENERLKKEVADLSRQVVHLLQEVEHSRIGSSSTSTDNDLSDSISSADIITKKLVTFNDISELQATNQKLLALVRELTERQEEVENIDPAAIANLKMKLEDLRESQNELLEERDRQNKMMVTLRNQRDMYKNLYTQAVKGSGEEVPSQLERTFLPENGETRMQTDSDTQFEEKIQDLENQVEKLNKQVEHLKEENETYRKEKSANEKILLEQLENMRGEVKELTRLNCKLSSHADLNEEKFKVLQNNVEIYKKQVAALEKQNKIYSESIIKHEQAATYLKDETLQSQTKLSKAEVMLANLQKENALLKDAEQRLLKERESLRRDSYQQNLIKSNIELIKATLERTDAEGKLRLESRLDEAHRECSALRRRLQEEQDHFRQLSDHLEKQSKAAQKRMEEEREQAEKLRKEVAEAREEIVLKTNQIEELSKKMKMGLFTVPDTNAEVRKMREIEQQLADANAEINSLKTKLKTAKEASDEYFNVAEASEKQVKDVLDQNELLRQEIEKQTSLVKELQEKCSELEGELSIQLDDQDISNASVKNKSTQLQEELNVRNMDLKTAREQLENARCENKSLIEQLKAVENKYAREVTLHSVDLQSLTTMKEDLDKAVDDANKLENDKTQAIEALNQIKSDWEQQNVLFLKEKEELESRFKDVDSQNSLLHDQIQALNTQLNILQAQATEQQNQSISEASFNKSFSEDDVKSSEQLLKIIKYLRQEKDIAVSKADIVEAEHLRLKSQFDMLNKQLEEAKAAIELERQKHEVSVVSAAKHAEVLRKLETLNAITDSNRSLRQERDSLLSQMAELRERADKLEIEVAPLQEKNRELTTKSDQLQSENISLRAECTRWRQRANMLIEKTNRTNPEDWKKLQTERETLAKQLTIERSTVTKLNDDINTLKQDKIKLEEQLRSLRSQNNQQAEEIARLRDEVTSLQAQVTQLTNTVDQQSGEILKYKEENRIITEDTAAKDVSITELKNNLAQIRKIAKKYKIQCEDQTKEIENLKQQSKQHDSEATINAEKQEQLLQEQRTEMEERMSQLESTHKDTVDLLNQQVTSSTEQIDNYKKEIESLKQSSLEKEERFKTLFKNAKERIVSLTEQNNSLKEELNKDKPARSNGSEQVGESSKNAELLEKIANLERERDEISEERQAEKDKFASELESLNQRVSQLQRQLGLQQGSKPSTSSTSSEKSSTERPTADIKPMAGHSTNTQTQSVPIQPWRSGGEPPLASIRPMSAQLRTVAVLPTSQSPSAVMVPPQQQVHTTGSSTIESLSSSPTSSHTDYVPATSSASSAMLGPRQVAVPPTQSSQDTEDDETSMQVQAAPQTQAVALVLPRVEPPSSGPTQEQGTSSSSSNTVTTTQAGHKRQRDSDTDSCQADDQSKTQQQSKRTRIQAGTVSDSGLDVEYQVPTSSQRDHDDDNVIVVESDEEGAADEGEGADDEQDDPDTEGYDMEGMEQDNYDDAECQEVEDEEEAGNEVEVIEDSSEVPNQSERSIQESPEEENSEQAQSEAISSGTDGTNGVTISQASTSVSITLPSCSRIRPIPSSLRSRPQSNLLPLHGLEEIGDDGIVPSTPTLYAPRRSDGFGEAVSSPHVPTSGSFTFNESSQHNISGSNEVVPEQTLDSGNLDETSTGRSVPTTPLQSSPQEALPGTEEQGSSQMTQSDAEIPSIMISADADDNETPAEGSSEECMGPPPVAGTSSEGLPPLEQGEEMLEGDDGVSSEGEKPLQTEEGEEEGREAEASPSTNSRRMMKGNSARRSVRTSIPRSNMQRSGPTPIVWGDRTPQRHPQERGRGTGSPNYQSRAVARRARGRMQRPFGGRF